MAALAAEQELARVRPSLLAFALAATPGLIVITCFLAIWFVGLLSADPREGRAYLTLGWRVEVDPVASWTFFVVLGAVLGVGVAWDMARKFRLLASTSIGVHARAVVARLPHGTLVLPFAEMGRVRVERYLTGASLHLRAPGAPVLVLSRRDAGRVVAALEAAGVACDVRDGAVTPPAGGFAPGEAVLWSGRPGFRSFDRTRALLAVMGGAPAVVFALWLWHVWSGPDSLLSRLVFTLVALGIVGATSLGILFAASGTIGDWLRDLGATVVVTERRVAWRAPFGGGPYREIQAGRILSADVIETDGRRGWVALCVEGDRPGRVEDMDLFGLPDPEGAAAAIRTIARRGSSCA